MRYERPRRKTPVIALVLATAALGGCRATVPIGHLLDDPYEYDGRKVKVEGYVGGAAGALGHGGYLLDDGSGELLVLVEGRGGLPRAGTRVAVTGWFRSLFTVGPLSAAMLLERDRDVRRGPPGPARD